MFRTSTLLSLALLASCPLTGHASELDCAQPAAKVLYALHSTPPLLANWSDATSIVEVHADGCLRVRRPAQFRDSGWFARRLSATEMNALHAEVEDSGIRSIDVAAVRSSLSQAKGEGRLHTKVMDAPIVAIRVAGKAGMHSITWPNLEQDRANHPTHPGIAGISRIERVLGALGRDGSLRLVGVER